MFFVEAFVAVLSIGHIAGIPVEETALTAAPVAAVVGGMALVRIRHGLDRAKASVRRNASNAPADKRTPDA